MRWDGGTTNGTSKDVYGAEVESDARECEDTEEDLVRVLHPSDRHNERDSGVQRSCVDKRG